MKQIGKYFLQGLIAVLPIAVTIYILVWLAVKAESILGGLIRNNIFGKNFYIPGMGVAAGFLIILSIGILLRLWLFRKLFHFGETILERLPVIKTLYGSVRDLTSFFDSSKKKDFNKVVMVSVIGQQTRLLGLVTREDFSKLPDGIDIGETVAVYLPMSYQMGGFTVYVPKKNIKPVDMTIEEAMRFALTAGVSTKKIAKSET